MPRTARNNTLENRTNRASIKQGKRVAVAVGEGLALLYRRGSNGIGTWQARRWQGDNYRFASLGEADDTRDADGVLVLTYFQAFDRARAWSKEAADRPRSDVVTPAGMATVNDALDAYHADYVKRGGKAADPVKKMMDYSIRPELGGILLSQLEPRHLRRWMQDLASKGRAKRTPKGSKPKREEARTDPDQVRARQATVNRIYSLVRAALNYAFREGMVDSDTAWRRVQPFQKVDQARIRFLTGDEAAKLLKHSPMELQRLVRAALLTGARFGELARLRVADFNPSTNLLYIEPGKSGKARHVPLNTEGIRFFTSIAGDRPPGAFALVRDDGKPWATKGYWRLLADACKAAEITPAITLHELRHTYASLLAQAGCDLLTISKLLGHADTRVTSRHYAHLCDATLAKAVTHLPEFATDRPRKLRAVK